MCDPRTVLGVSATATPEEIRKAYQKLALFHHPDKNAGSAEAAVIFQSICVAYHALLDEATPQAKIGLINMLQLTYLWNEHLVCEETYTLIQPEAAVEEQTSYTYENPLYQEYPNKLVFHDPYRMFSTEALTKMINDADAKYAGVEKYVTENAFLWRARKAGCADVFIFNLLHTIDFDPDNIFGDALRKVLSEVTTVYTEVENYDIAIPEKKPKSGEQYEILFDNLIIAMAHALNKKLQVLENHHIRYLCSEGTYAPIESYWPISPKRMKNLSKNYLTHIVPPFSRLREDLDEDFRRTKFWMNAILAESREQNPALIICGGLHSAGKFGLPNLLSVEGYTLEPLMKYAPVPRSKQLRHWMRMDQPHFFSNAAVIKPAKGNPNEERRMVVRSQAL